MKIYHLWKGYENKYEGNQALILLGTFSSLEALNAWFLKHKGLFHSEFHDKIFDEESEFSALQGRHNVSTVWVDVEYMNNEEPKDAED